jgi:hypothetical protein
MLQPNPKHDPFQEEITTRYCVRTGEAQPSSNDAPPESCRRTREPMESRTFAVIAPVPTVLSRRMNVEFVPLHVMRQLVTTFANFVGPSAKSVVIDEVVNLHYGPARFPASLLHQLTERLVRHIGSSVAAAQFLDELQPLHPGFSRAHR